MEPAGGLDLIVVVEAEVHPVRIVDAEAEVIPEDIEEEDAEGDQTHGEGKAGEVDPEDVRGLVVSGPEGSDDDADQEAEDVLVEVATADAPVAFR